MKILNLYAGIGGNRKLWGDDHEITAVELNPKIASIYQDFFPQDNVVVGDAHQYLLDHFKEFDFIWSSPPCPSHSKINKLFTAGRGKNPIKYPDMKLYEEILLLQNYANQDKQKWCIENVISFYKPLIAPHEVDSHYYWSNFYIRPKTKKSREHYGGEEKLGERKGFNISNYSGINKIKTLRNCVEPEVGLHIFNEAFKSEVQSLF
jgi:DNA (cytosine-5)-methyltransferase 1